MSRDGSVLAKPDRGAVEQPTADVVAGVEHITELFLPEVDAVETDLDPRHDREAPLGSVGDRCERIDGRDLEGEFDPSNPGQFGGEDQEVGWEPQRRKGPREGQGERETLDRIIALRDVEHPVLEADHDPRVDLESEVQIERPTARVLGVQVDLPRLAHRVGLDEVAFVVHMERVIDGVVLEVGHEAGNIDDGHGQQATVVVMDDRILCEVLDETAAAIRLALGDLDDWGLAGTRAGQYHSDLAADAAALSVLERAGVGVLSEESGRHRPEAPITVVLDPLDGSTNASRGIPWYATSLCAVDGDGARAALVINLATGDRFEAVRGAGATRNGVAIATSGATVMRESLIALSGFPDHWLGWYQFRSLGACALDLCAVACGVADGYIDCSWNAHGSWDYLGGLLVCREAGAVIVDAEDRDLVALGHDDRRTPVAAATPELLTQLVDARRSIRRP